MHSSRDHSPLLDMRSTGVRLRTLNASIAEAAATPAHEAIHEYMAKLTHRINNETLGEQLHNEVVPVNEIPTQATHDAVLPTDLSLNDTQTSMSAKSHDASNRSILHMQDVPQATHQEHDQHSSDGTLLSLSCVPAGEPLHENLARLSTKYQDQPSRRLQFTPTQALALIVVLCVALSASLTMLVTQYYRFSGSSKQISALYQDGVNRSDSRVRGSLSGHHQRNSGDYSSVDNASSDSDNTVAGSKEHADGGVVEKKHAGASRGVQQSDQSDHSTDLDGSANAQRENASNGASNAVNQDNTSESMLIDLNSATSLELQSIKGIGPGIAKKILDYRSKIGYFSSVDQLLGVSGIGSKTLAKIRPYVTVLERAS